MHVPVSECWVEQPGFGSAPPLSELVLHPLARLILQIMRVTVEWVIGVRRSSVRDDVSVVGFFHWGVEVAGQYQGVAEFRVLEIDAGVHGFEHVHFLFAPVRAVDDSDVPDLQSVVGDGVSPRGIYLADEHLFWEVRVIVVELPWFPVTVVPQLEWLPLDRPSTDGHVTPVMRVRDICMWLYG